MSLTSKERETLAKTIGNLASPLAIAVAQLYLCESGQSQWSYACWGAFVFVMDRDAQTKFMRLYSMQQDGDNVSFECVFEQELYNGFDYQALTSTFHCFEAEGAMVGLNFAGEREAQNMSSKVRSLAPKQSASTPTGSSLNANRTNTGRMKSFFNKGARLVKNFISGEDDESQSVAQISGPTNFQHKQHIGFDPERGFQIRDIPPEWRSFFKNIGIKKKELQNPETAKIIMDAMQEVNSGAAASPVAAAGTMSAPATMAPPPPPPKPQTPTSASAGSGGPPPPPPPPMPAANSAPVPPPPPPSGSPGAMPSAVGMPSAAGLRPTPPKPAAASTSGGSSDLLSQIRAGAKLKSVEERKQQEVALPDLSKMSQNQTNNLAHTIAAQILARRTQLSTEEVEDDSENEWSD